MIDNVILLLGLCDTPSRIARNSLAGTQYRKHCRNVTHITFLDRVTLASKVDLYVDAVGAPRCISLTISIKMFRFRGSFCEAKRMAYLEGLRWRNLKNSSRRAVSCLRSAGDRFREFPALQTGR